MTVESKKEALESLKCVVQDFEMLKRGDWEPDDDSCQCSIDAVESVIAWLEECHESSST